MHLMLHLGKVLNEVAPGICRIGNDQISIQPNPIRSTSSIHVSEPYLITGVQIIDAFGKRSKMEVMNSPSSVHELDMSNFGNGVYVLEIRLDNGQVVRKKVIKS